MSYDYFDRDFVERTLKNLEQAKVDYDVTNLINSCFGLIILPLELSNRKGKSFPIDSEKLKNNEYGHLKKCTRCCKNKPMSVLKHMRNAMAHGYIQQSKTSTTNEISELKFEDKRYGKSKEVNFRMYTTIDQLKTFATDIANAYLAQLEEMKSLVGK